MNPIHVTGLELSKRLKELGVPQKSEFYWVDFFKNGNWGLWSAAEKVVGEIGQTDYQAYAAFLASELLEMLPVRTRLKKVDFMDKTTYHCEYTEKRGDDSLKNRRLYADSPSDSLAKMLIHLIENGIVKAGELK